MDPPWEPLWNEGFAQRELYDAMSKNANGVLGSAEGGHVLYNGSVSIVSSACADSGIVFWSLPSAYALG